MTSLQSDSESNLSGFIRYSNKNFKHLYASILESMKTVNEDMAEIEKNLTSLVKEAGPLESQLSALLSVLPKNPVSPMDTTE